MIPGASSKGGRSVIARWLQQGPVYARLDKADAAAQRAMRLAQPNFFLPFDRSGIDPFTERFPVTLRLEGTVRGTGGLRIVDERCATTLPGLFAAGDAATRELICGGFTGGGSHNAAWAMASGHRAGLGAAGHAQAIGATPRRLHRAGRAALAAGRDRPQDPAALIAAVRAEVLPYDRNYFRHADRLEDSLGRLDVLWASLRMADAATPEAALRTREAAAMLATARWMYRSALARRESRGMHRREDAPALDAAQRHHVTAGGLDAVWTAPRPAAPLPVLEQAA
ncbi:FAD-binding protein [Paracraurococcus lichenis]|uniref:FAD-binding protein n=1 Tax=Paracraurococcus lichenis TaxID=3064888 RepID=A0ABT9E5M1_9PROT|nr:FAD-binding protein [Paracraurococcus sp. LOR1-02]MDO9711461.1 FAD-binding protein [Paracraurococcus sp. LOR1-02]